MRYARRKWFMASAVIALFCFTSPALADSVSITLGNPPGSNIIAGIYVGPYVATVNGQTVYIVCDDFVDESTAGQSWTATVYNFGSLGQPGTTTKWGNNLTGYEEAAWLVMQMFSSSDPTVVGELQFAIWAIFDYNDVMNFLNKNAKSLPAGFIAAVQQYVTNAQNSYSQLDYSNFLIYTPQCKNGVCGPPQEFLTIPTPEVGELASYLALTGIAGIAVFLSNRRKQARSA